MICTLCWWDNPQLHTFVHSAAAQLSSGARAGNAFCQVRRAICCRYSYENAPIQKELEAREVGNAAAFLLSPLASAITGSVVYVDNGLNAMALAIDSQALLRPEKATA